jgi:NAD(P)-dependent dehydrogenase (short-subunit alcohol dehydrogenase family)
MDKLSGKRAIVTGGASGIGRATALLMAQEGASVAILDVDVLQGAALAAEINAGGGAAIFVACDVTCADECRLAVQTVIKAFGGLDVLFNNAGIIRRADVIGTSEEDWDRVMDVNVKSVFLMCKFAVPEMVKSGGGSIINSGSGWGLKGGSLAVSYCASKGAVVNLTRALAIDHGPQNIRANSINPGDVDTPMLRNEAAQMGQTEAIFLAEAANRPLRRFGQPIEIAQAVVFLASDESSYISGAALVVDGGGIA